MPKKSKNQTDVLPEQGKTTDNVTISENKQKKNSDYSYVIKNKRVRRDTRHRKIVVVVAFVLLLLIGLGALIYGVMTVVEINSFKVFVDSSGNKVLSLSDTADFVNASEVIEITGPDTMDNTTLASGKNLIDSTSVEDVLLSIIDSDGVQSDKNDNYIAGSFYLRNTTDTVQYYNEFMRLRNVTKNIDAALRIMLVKNYELTVYAKPSSDGNPEKVVPLPNSDYLQLEITEDADGNKVISKKADQVWMSTPFYSEEYAIYNTGLEIQPGETVKYSIIIWLEGWDPDCVDSILHGTITVDFGFEQYS